MPDQFSLPLRIGADGQLVTVAQGSPDELAQRIHVLCVTRPGFLDGRPAFGLANQAFRRGGANVAEVERQIDTYIPDAQVAVDRAPDTVAGALQTIGLRVSIR